MNTRYRISLFGTQLDQLLQSDERFRDRVVILNIGHAEPGYSLNIETPGDADGGMISRKYRQKATVTVTFGLYIYDIAAREEACEKIRTLCAKGGTIMTNDKPGKALYNCVCEQYPEIDSARDWTAPIQMTFSAYYFPYWVNSIDSVKSITGKKTSAALSVPGNAPGANMTVEITALANFSKPKNNAVNLRVDVGSTNLQFSYQFTKNNLIVIDQDSQNNLRVRLYDNATSRKLITSLLPYMLPKSSDKLIAAPGSNNTVSIDSAQSISAVFKTKGAWL